MSTLDVSAIEQSAREELAQEAFRAAVEARKEKLKAKRPWWRWLLPFTVTVTITKE